MRVIFNLLMMLTLWSCATHSPKTAIIETNPTSLDWIAPNVDADVVQLLSGARADQEFAFQSRVKIDESALTLVLIDSLGNRAMSLYWDVDGIVEERSASLPKFVKAEYILKDIIFAFWPAELIPKILDLPVVVVDMGLSRREVIIAGANHYTIIYQSNRQQAWGEAVTLENQTFDYSLTIQSQMVSNE